MRFRQLFDADLIQSSQLKAVEEEVISPDQLEAILSQMCYGLPATATIEEVRKAESAAIGRATSAGTEDLKTKLRNARLKMERKPDEKF